MDAPDRGDHDGWNVRQAFGEMGGRTHDPRLAIRATFDFVPSFDHPPAGGIEVELLHLRLGLGVADHEPPAARLVAARRALLRKVDAVEDCAVVDLAFEIEP